MKKLAHSIPSIYLLALLVLFSNFSFGFISGYIEPNPNSEIEKSVAKQCSAYAIDLTHNPPAPFFWELKPEDPSNNFLLSIYFGVFDKHWLRNRSEITRLAKNLGFDAVYFFERRSQGVYGFVAINSDMTLIHYRGSSFERDAGVFAPASWLTDIRFGLSQDDDFLSAAAIKKGARIHNGFMAASKASVDEINEIYRRENISRSSSVYVTGHSLGGALAVLTGYQMTQKGFKIAQVLTSGQPKVGNLAFSKELDQVLSGRYFRLIQSRDPIVLLPLAFGNSATVENTSQVNSLNEYIYAHGGIAYELSNNSIGKSSRPGSILSVSWPKHKSINYFCHLLSMKLLD